MRTIRRLALAILATLAVGAATACATAAHAQREIGAPALVILVRHAEKATSGGSDPDLSDIGLARAKALALSLADAHVTAIVTSTFKRTFETAEPYAAAHGTAVEKVAIDGTTAQHVAAVTAAVRAHGGEVVLVVGHSNTIPAIVAALGGPKLPDICDASYGTFFILQPAKGSAPANVVRVKYGAAEPDAAERCSTSMK
jgi:broad specificity phosphatase PhoE